MNEEQYKRANSAVFPVISIILGYIAVSMLMWANSNTPTWKTWLQLAVAVSALVVSAGAYLFGRKTKECGIIMLVSASMAYMAVSLVGTTISTWAYALPVLLISMAYLNVKLVVCGNVLTLVVNVLRFMVNTDSSAMTEMVLAMITLTLAAFASIRASMLLIRFFKENTDEIKKASKKQEESNKKMASIAEDIIGHFEHAMEMLDNLKNSIETSNFAMSNIVESTESTAEAIQNQAEMCADIQVSVDRAEEGTKRMLAASDSTDKMVDEGTEVVKELKEQAQNVEQASKITVDVIEQLTVKVEEVQSFVGVILSISSQTNLLALNASIEAARAGEAGKGFAVVADEIRQLSDQTKEASNNIKNIIKELNEDTRRANESIENAAASVTRQNELIENTKEKFERVDKEVSELAENVKNTEQIIGGIVSSTGVISENITQLSATSQEVAASSTEGLRTSEATVADMAKTREILEGIYVLAQDLKQTI